MTIRKLFTNFRSLKFTVVLIIGLVVVFFLGLVVPQRELLGPEAYTLWKTKDPGLVSFLEKLHLTDVYRSPLTITLWALFSLNLVAYYCTAPLSRIPRRH